MCRLWPGASLGGGGRGGSGFCRDGEDTRELRQEKMRQSINEACLLHNSID